jgi:hypothetical protein
LIELAFRLTEVADVERRVRELERRAGESHGGTSTNGTGSLGWWARR